MCRLTTARSRRRPGRSRGLRGHDTAVVTVSWHAALDGVVSLEDETPTPACTVRTPGAPGFGKHA